MGGDSPLKKYSPSGKCSVLTLPSVIVASIVGAPLGWFYQRAIDWIPLIYLNFLVTVVLCFAVVMLARLAVRIGKCRNIAFGAIAGLLVGSTVLAATYRSGMEGLSNELRAALQRELKANAEVSVNPNATLGLGEYVALRKEMGWHISYKGKGDLPITGNIVLLFWFLEGATLILAGLAGGIGGASEPFSEQANRWADHKVLVREQHVDSDVVNQMLKRASSVDELVRPVPEVNPLMARDPKVVKYFIATCPGGEDIGFLTIEAVTKFRDKEGKEQEKSETLFTDLILEPRQLDALEAEWKRSQA